jgi:HD-like signal output (HDOD) protein
MSQNDKKRVILCGPSAMRERLGRGKQFTFVAYGKADPTLLSGINQTETDGVVVCFGPENPEALPFVDRARQSAPELPCFVLCQETEQIQLAEYGWQIIAITDRTNATDIEDRLARSFFLFPLVQRESLRRILGVLKKIPAEAASHQKIVQLLHNPEFQLDDVARMIKQDMALTAQLLKMANSAAFSRARPVQDINEAVAMLGSAKLQALISSAWAFFLMKDNLCQGFNPRKEWEHANLVADRVAKACAAKGLDATTTDTAVISAMLHDIGKLLLAANLPLDYSAVLQAGATKEHGVWEAENEMFGFNHAEVGGCLLALWGLPLPVAEDVLHHHYQGQTDDVSAALIREAHEKTGETEPESAGHGKQSS